MTATVVYMTSTTVANDLVAVSGAANRAAIIAHRRY